jgi:hypothetical protein
MSIVTGAQPRHVRAFTAFDVRGHVYTVHMLFLVVIVSGAGTATRPLRLSHPIPDLIAAPSRVTCSRAIAYLQLTSWPASPLGLCP